MSQNYLLYQHRIIIIFRKRDVRQAVWGGGIRNSKIEVILNQYKNTLDDFINSSDPKLPHLARLIDDKSLNVFMSKGNSADLSKKNCLGKNLPNRLLQLVLKAGNS